MQKNQGSAFPHVLEWLLLGAVFVYLAFFVFAWNSDQTITLRYWASLPARESKAAFPVLASFLVGFFVATIAASLFSLDRLIELRRVRKRMRGLQEEIARLRIGAEPAAAPVRTTSGPPARTTSGPPATR